MSNLQSLELSSNPRLLTPPPEIVAHGIDDIRSFLKALQANSITRFEAKLLVVGEGGTGKSTLLYSLREQTITRKLLTTHGIELGALSLTHLSERSQSITLNTWDFGGQHIYHATHQFFLTKRSLYLVVWNARLGADQGNLKYWLEIIQALAPEAPVLLVATHIDERAPDLNYQLYKDAYPQLQGSINVSNLDGRGIDELKNKLYELASMLPLMGQPWPQNWVRVEQALVKRRGHHIDGDTYVRLCKRHSVNAEIAKGTLGSYLYDLGKILYFRDDQVLNKLVILKPNWITKAISCVLEDETTSIRNKGILLHSDLPRIWANDDAGHRYDSELYPVFLRLMERFDLSYQIESDELGKSPTKSLIPQLLPHQPPHDLSPWPRLLAPEQTQVEVVYRFDFIPPGIMSWFIVRTHRYTRNLHWRDGVMLAYQGQDARVELNPMLKELRLQVRGIQPQNFFTILKNTLDLILARFEGLHFQCEVPCICSGSQNKETPCPRSYRYDDLVRLMNAGRLSLPCMHSLQDVSVPEMLYGIHMSTDQQVMVDIRRGQQEITSKLGALDQLSQFDILAEKINQLSQLVRQNFTRQWNQVEALCPNLFFLMPGSDTHFNPKNWVSQEYRLYLLCQYLPHPHRAGDVYLLRQEAVWWKAVSPWLNHLVELLKVAVPMVGPLVGIHDAAALKALQPDVNLMEEITRSIPLLDSQDGLKPLAATPHMGSDIEAVGPALRALHSFLKEIDHDEVWGGLYKTPTPDGNILWLCKEHWQEYQAKSLTLGS